MESCTETGCKLTCLHNLSSFVFFFFYPFWPEREGLSGLTCFEWKYWVHMGKYFCSSKFKHFNRTGPDQWMNVRTVTADFPNRINDTQTEQRYNELSPFSLQSSGIQETRHSHHCISLKIQDDPQLLIPSLFITTFLLCWLLTLFCYSHCWPKALTPYYPAYIS